MELGKTNNEKSRLDGRIWLAYIAVSAIVTMVMGIENALENKLSFVVFAIFTFAPIILLRNIEIIGLTKKNLKASILTGIGVGIIYGIIRGLFLKFVPASAFIFGADLARIALKLESGIKIGALVITPADASIFLLLFMFPFMIAMEMYFRGLLFLTAKKYVSWPWAIAIASAVQAVARRTPHSLIMGSIGGVLMQKYDNIMAPSFMHGVQFFTALGVVLYL